MFEFVKILNEEEARKWWEFIFKKQEEKAMKCQTAIRQNSDLLLREYDNYLRELQETEKAEKQSIEQMIELFEHKKCYCGGKLRYISTYDFWGCENYKDTSQKHLTINNENYWKEAAENYRLSVPAHWLSHIIDRANLRNNVTSKRLLEFYLENDRKDLRMMFENKSTLNSISGFEKGRAASKTEEKEIGKLFESVGFHITEQMIIRYKKVDELPKTKIFDLVASDDYDVYLVEIKRETTYIDETQLELYRQLLSYLMKKKNDQRNLKVVYLTYAEDTSYFENQIKSISFYMVKDFKTISELKKELDYYAYY